MGDSVIIGRSTDTGDEVRLSAEGRRLSTYLIGTIGTGKSTLLLHMASQDMQNGEGLCFLDPHDDAAEELLLQVPEERKEDVIFWDPTDRESPFGLNPFHCPDPEQIDAKADNFIAALESLAEFSDAFAGAHRMKSVLRHLAITFIVNQGHTLAETWQFLDDPAFRQPFYPALSAEFPQVLAFWQRLDRRPEKEQREMTDSSLNKLERFQIDRTMKGIFGQPTPSVDFRQAMDEGKIVIVKLHSSRLGPNNAALVGAFTVWELFQAAISRIDTPTEERRQYHLIADEFQTYMTTAFPRLIEEVRKFGVDVAIAHQRRGQLREGSMDAPLVCGNKIVFQVIGHDAVALAKEFDVTPPPPPVIGEKSKLTFALDPWRHLEQHGHSDPDVQKAFMLVNRTLLQIQRDLEAMRRLIGYDHINVPMRMAEVHEMMREFLFARMQGKEDDGSLEQVHAIYFIGGVLSKRPVDISRPREADRYKLLEVRSNVLHCGLLVLGTLLAQAPIMTPSSEYDEPILEKPRLYSDVAAEVANTLVTLPKHTARCTLREDGQHKEYTIQTLPLPEAPEGGYERAEWIRENSRRLYGRDRRTVEREIARRLQVKATAADRQGALSYYDEES